MKDKVLQPPCAPSAPPPVDSRSNLMDEIKNRNGALRHVSQEEKTPPVASEPRNQMLDLIRQGVALKKVEVEEGEVGGTSSAPGIAGMLQRALQERGLAVGMSSSEEESEDDDEWDD